MQQVKDGNSFSISLTEEKPRTHHYFLVLENPELQCGWQVEKLIFWCICTLGLSINVGIGFFVFFYFVYQLSVISSVLIETDDLGLFSRSWLGGMIEFSVGVVSVTVFWTSRIPRHSFSILVWFVCCYNYNLWPS